MQCMEELLGGLAASFPYCEKVQSTHKDFVTTLKPNPILYDFVIRQWHAELKPHYQDVKERNVDKLIKAEISIFRKIDIKTKWEDPSFDAQSRELLLMYLMNLNGLAEIHCAVPAKMMETLDGIARKTVSMFEGANSGNGGGGSGTNTNSLPIDPQKLCSITERLLSGGNGGGMGNDGVDLADLTAQMPQLGEFQNMMQSLMQQINPDDLQELMTQMPLINSTVMNMLKNVPGGGNGGSGGSNPNALQ